MQGSDCILEAVEQQDLDTVQILLYQYTADELDLNTPNSQGLTSLDIAIMTNNAPMATLLLRAGAKESPHCESHVVLVECCRLWTNHVAGGLRFYTRGAVM
jgi:ankyrin repeat protein